MSENKVSEEQLIEAGEKLGELRRVLQNVLFSQEALIDSVITGLLSGGHILLESTPGLGKTELVKALSKAIDLDPSRVQFTPDLLPGDVTGNPVLEEENGKRKFVFQAGPIFANLVLADEINRASPKTQSALLEAMQEQRVTVMGETHNLPNPFFVVATQNPIELEGTYPLPEAQLDRFLFKLHLKPGGSEVLEKIISNRTLGVDISVEKVLTREELVKYMDMAKQVYLPPSVANFIARLVDATHANEGAGERIRFGASPRAAIALAAAGRSRALLAGRSNTSFEDIEALAADVINHRIVLDYRAKLDGMTGRSVVAEILNSVRPLNKPTPALLQDGV